MEFPGKKLLRLIVERDPASPEFRSGVREAFKPSEKPVAGTDDFNLWGDVFVEQPLPWGRFVQSALVHTLAVVLIWTISIAWIRQQKILERAAFDKTALVTYTPDEYLPPLDTGSVKPPKAQKGDPAFAKQPILSVPREADNHSQTIVAPPDLKLNHDVPMPNMVATGMVMPAVPLEATRAPLKRIAAPDVDVVAPAPDVQFAADRVVQSAMKSDVIGPPPELTQSTKGHASTMNIGQSAVVAPAPQLALEEQHAVAGRSGGHLPSGNAQVVGPPPSVASTGGTSSGGRLVALGIHPVAASGPVAAAGNRRGSFSANPQGKLGASGTPELTGSKTDGTAGRSGRNNGSLPAGLKVGAGANGDGTREVASASVPAAAGKRTASVVPDEKITDVDRQVFRGKRMYEMRLNMPNLNSSSGSWVMKFAELENGRKEGDLLTPVLTEKSDPGYPLELMKTNVHGMVTLYAVIHSDGKVGDIRVLNSPDERLDPYAAKALARWKFVPAERAGKPVALEAVVEIPFQVKHSF
jgi:TonB family protein